MQTYRLYLNEDLSKNNIVLLEEKDSHYLKTVLRLRVGDKINLFNAGSGEFEGVINEIAKKSITVLLKNRLDKKILSNNLTLAIIFAPIKSVKNEFIIEKATELGVNIIQPVLTARTVVRSINRERYYLATKEATEQCGRLDVPEIKELIGIYEIFKNYPDYKIIFCNEYEQKISFKDLKNIQGKVALLTGPEGGFSAEEVAFITKQPNVISVSLGNNILRAETAIILGLGLIKNL
ncbi:MAG: RsmE family RNA methyltransferase [Alphaproteobacteria bacterium]|jgi:16S rRNA (uracil1498-N3)-methyltransferase